MLLRRAWLVAPPQPREDAVLLQQCLPRRALDLDHLGLLDIRPRRDGVEVQVLAQHDDARAVAQHVARRARGAVRHVVVLRGGRAVGDRLRDVAEELEHVLQRGGVVL